MTASYLELYQERAKDLLGDPKKKESLEVRTHPVYGVFVPGLTEFPLTSEEDVKRLLKYGNQLRVVGGNRCVLGYVYQLS